MPHSGPSRINYVSTKETVMSILYLVKESSDAFTPLKSVTSGVLFIAETVDSFQSNQKEWRDLAVHIARTVKRLAKTITGPGMSEELKDDIEHLALELASIGEEISQMAARHAFHKFAQAKADVQKIANFKTRIDSAMIAFGILTTLGLRRDWDISRTRGDAYKQVTREQDITLSLQPRSGFDAVARSSIFYGRYDTVEDILGAIKQSLNQKSGARLVIRGGGGLGKTSLALAVLHREATRELFGSRIFFTSCEVSPTYLLLIYTITSALGLTTPKAVANPLQPIQDFLSREPTLMILDDFEMPWDGEDQEDVRKLLLLFDSIPFLTLILTLRGSILPDGIQWTKPILPPLGPLTLRAARETFMDIAGSDHDQVELDKLLESIDRVPLAITLMAQIAQTGLSVSTLQYSWDREQTGLLFGEGTTKSTNMDISIGISLSCKTIRSNPSSLRLLTAICHLPNGASCTSLHRIVALQNPRVAFRSLVSASLIYEDENTYFKALSPIRRYIRNRPSHFPLHPEDKIVLLKYYTELADKLGRPESGNGRKLRRFSDEWLNMHAILELFLNDSEYKPSTEFVRAVVAYHKCHHASTTLDLLDQLVVDPNWDSDIEPAIAAEARYILMTTYLLRYDLRDIDKGDDYLDRAFEEAKGLRAFCAEHKLRKLGADVLLYLAECYKRIGAGEEATKYEAQARSESELLPSPPSLSGREAWTKTRSLPLPPAVAEVSPPPTKRRTSSPPSGYTPVHHFYQGEQAIICRPSVTRGRSPLPVPVRISRRRSRSRSPPPLPVMILERRPRSRSLPPVPVRLFGRQSRSRPPSPVSVRSYGRRLSTTRSRSTSREPIHQRSITRIRSPSPERRHRRPRTRTPSPSPEYRNRRPRTRTPSPSPERRYRRPMTRSRSSSPE